MSAPGALLPPPTFHPEHCAAGGGGSDGCRACVTACPRSALSVRPGPGPSTIHVNEVDCVRCGACTAVCPTSSLERAYLPDEELRRLIVDASRASHPVLVTGDHHLDLADRARSDGWGVVELPSLLILDQSAMLVAHLSGASAVAVVGCADCHHDALDLVVAASALAASLTGRPGTTVVAGISAPDLEAALAKLDDGGTGEAAPIAPPLELPDPVLRRRAALAQLVSTDGVPCVGDDPLADIGRVLVDAEGCTLCGACVRSCPTSALSFDLTVGVLSTRDIECVSCGQCVAACPENVLDVSPATRTGLLERRALVSDQVVPCSVCAGPHLPARLLDRAREVLAASGRPPTHASRQLDRCPSCRTVDTDGLRARPASPDVPEPIGVPQLDRRAFIGASAASLGGVLGMVAAGTVGAEPVAAQDRKADVTPGRLGMVIDLRTCIGCHACSAVCKAENHVPLGVYRDWVEEYTLGEYPDARPVFLPKLCNHCDDPGCMRACPTGAIYRRVDGIVDLDHDMCIGCRACNEACPSGCTFMDPVRHTADKCNLCAHRVDEGLRPACVDVCPSQCRVFGDLDDPESSPRRLMAEQPTTVLRPELGLGPNIHYVGMPSDLGEPTTATTVTSQEH